MDLPVFQTLKLISSHTVKNFCNAARSSKFITDKENMNTVGSILLRKNRAPIVISPDATVISALEIMAGKNIGSVIVMEGDKYLGLMTERDYSRKVVLRSRDSATTPVSEIMTRDLPFVSPKDSIDHCMQLMTSNNIRYLPVFENNRFAGIISMSDVVKETIMAQKDTINHLQSYINS
jgi:CBS domain-containing protein